MNFQLTEYKKPDFSEAAFRHAPDAVLSPVLIDAVAPEQYHATTIYPEYFKIAGQWLLAEESRMDCVAVCAGGRMLIKEFRNLLRGDLVVTGRTEKAEEGIYVHMNGFLPQTDANIGQFAFRQGRSRETAFSMDYDFIYELLRHEKQHGKIVWVLGPACAFDADARNAFSRLIEQGYVHTLLAGNALAVHDLEGAYRKTALGQDIYTQKIRENGHYNHLDTINQVRRHGSMQNFIKNEQIRDGIIYRCIQQDIPLVLVGSVRDDGPLPEVYANVYQGQDAMRTCIRQATTVICLATTLHAIAIGNMTPAYRVMPDGKIREVYFYTVDISEFAINKLADRGSMSAKGIVTNIQDFLVNLGNGLKL